MILTVHELMVLADAVRKQQRNVRISLDLGRSLSEVALNGSFVVFPDGSKVDVRSLKRLDARSCYIVRDALFVKVQLFSLETRRHYKLVPTRDWPTLTISGVPMHQKTRMTPKEDALAKTNALQIYGNVLDTCCGLGYTAILASQKADHVMTVEHDQSVLQLARLNPYSQELFTRKNIQLLEGDVASVIRTFSGNTFDVVLHDPPTFSLAGELYGRVFYQGLFRVLKPGCWLFHYTGRPGIRSGRIFIQEVIKRLEEIGFRNIKKVMDDQAVVCQR